MLCKHKTHHARTHRENKIQINHSRILEVLNLRWYWRVFRISCHSCRWNDSWARRRSLRQSESGRGASGRSPRACESPAWACVNTPWRCACGAPPTPGHNRRTSVLGSKSRSNTYVRTHTPHTGKYRNISLVLTRQQHTNTVARTPVRPDAGQ